MSIKRGDQVTYRDAFNFWRVDGVADSEVESTHVYEGGRRIKIHDFPVVWVLVPRLDGTGIIRTPWPTEDVRRREPVRDEEGKAQ